MTEGVGGRQRAAIAAAAITEGSPHTDLVDFVPFEALKLDACADAGLGHDAHTVQFTPVGQHGVVASQATCVHDAARCGDRGLLDLTPVEFPGDVGTGRLADH